MNKIYRNENSIIYKNEYFDTKTGDFLSILETQNFYIIQVVDSYYSNRFTIDEHYQNCDVEITYSLTNGLVCVTDGKSCKVNKHEAYISFKGETHELISNRGCRFQTIALNAKEGAGTQLLNTLKALFGKERVCKIQEISDPVTSVVAEFVSADAPFFINYLDSLIISILVKLARIGICAPESDLLSTAETLPAIVNYIDAHFLEIFSLEELSSHFGYDYGHICKTFRKCYGITPGGYLNSKKMDYAAMLLKKGKSVKYISEKLNYSTPYNFSRAFKNAYGISPIIYAKENN